MERTVGIGSQRPSRRSLRDLLRVRTLFNAIKTRPQAEERSQSASRSTHQIDAALPRRSLCGRRSSAGRLILQCRLMGKDEIKGGDPLTARLPVRDSVAKLNMTVARG